MADIKSPDARSLNMSKIRSRDTKPEMWLRKRLFERGYRYRKNANNIPGHPDAWLAKYNAAIFVHGCFWHRHRDCKYAYMPKSRVNFWQDKFQKNTERDQKVREELLARGTKMLIVWECTVKKMMRQDEYFNEMIDKIEDFLHSRGKFMEI
nr:MAG TPA: DNA G:T-mismatch repair endonuclease [Caudoviricetes sp.]